MINKKIFTIAEVGINHNGDMNICKKLIDNAIQSGFDCVKFQKRTIDLVYSKEDLAKLRESPWGTTQRQQKEGLEFNQNQYDEINKYCKQKNFSWFASAWDIKSLEFLDQYEFKYNKIASAMITDISFLESVASRKKHTFISTGMSTEEDITKAVEIFQKKNTSFELMHCVSSYPTPEEDINLETINFIREKFKCNVGYSGHENGSVISIAACMYNITSIERHITLDRTMYGSDQSASLEYSGMKFLIDSIKKIQVAVGTNKLGFVTEQEKEIAKKLRAHIKS